jgi:hypothetical protein
MITKHRGDSLEMINLHSPIKLVLNTYEITVKVNGEQLIVIVKIFASSIWYQLGEFSSFNASKAITLSV